MQDIKEEIIAAGLPEHIAIIMDGNGRWAEQRGLDRVYGHKQGVDTVKSVVEASGEIGLKYLTLYTFSIENWNRPKAEVDALKVRVKVIGNTGDLPEEVWHKLEGLIHRTAANTGVTLVLALSYGARWEIVEAARRLMADYKAGKVTDTEEVTDELFARYLTTAGIPDPDLLIRTSGECRLSNFLLWQCAYTEFYFIDKFWPDFEKDDLYLAIRNFQQRERRFGMTGEQIKVKGEKGEGINVTEK